MSDETPVDAAIDLVETQGVFGAKEYATRMLGGKTARGEAFWKDVSGVLESLDARQTRAVNLAKLQRMRSRAASPITREE